MSISTVMILAAGLGKRLRPYTNKVPKPLIKIGKYTLIEKIIKKLEKLKFKKIVINLHYLKEKMKKTLNKRYKIDIFFSEEKNLLNTGGGVKNALKIIDKKEFFVINSDIIWSDHNTNPFKNLNNFWNKNKMDALLLLYPVEKDINNLQGDFCLDNSGKLLNKKKNKPQYIFTGIQILKSNLFNNIKKEIFPLSFIYNQLILKKRIYGLVYKGKWSHIGTLETLKQYKKMIQ